MATMKKDIGALPINPKFSETLLSSIDWKSFVERYPQVLDAQEIRTGISMNIPNHFITSSGGGRSYTPDAQDVLEACKKTLYYFNKHVSHILGETWSYTTGYLSIEAKINGMHEHFHYEIIFRE